MKENRLLRFLHLPDTPHLRAFARDVLAQKDEDEWKTINGTHVLIGENGEVKSGPTELKKVFSGQNTRNGNRVKKREKAGESGNNRETSHERPESSRQSLGGNITEQELRNALMSSPKENVSGIRRHVMDDAWVKQRDRAFAKGDLPKSGLTVSEKRIRGIVSNRLKTGDFETTTAKRGDARATMRFSDQIGIVFRSGNDGIKGIASHTLCVVYSKKDGYHFFPVFDKE